jgi:hypothetical protein
MVVNIEITIFWDVTRCMNLLLSIFKIEKVSRDFYLEDGSNRFLRNVSTILSDNMASQPTRQ